MRTALYIRYSTTKQLHGASLTDQLARLRHDARTNNETIVGEYIDQARTGTSAAKRDAFQQLLTAARKHAFERVRVESVDRGHRNDDERRQFESEMKALGIEVVYSGEPDKQAPHQRKLHRGIRGVLAEYESDETSQRTYKRQLYRAKQGKWRGGLRPYGLRPNGQGWFEPDPESYPVLLWILERRVEGQGIHTITKMLNQGISINGGPRSIPPTASMLAYLRKPYSEHQDPETGEVIHLHREPPAGVWGTETVRRLCEAATDGIYAGYYVWGKEPNRFDEDGDGNPKEIVCVDTGQRLIPESLYRQIAALNYARKPRERAAINMKNTFLLTLECGLCGSQIHGYTSTKEKKGRTYRYRTYRCGARVNSPGSCHMPMLRAARLEHAVITAILHDLNKRAPDLLLHEVSDAISRYRAELLDALTVLALRLNEAQQVRDDALDSVSDRRLSALLHAAVMERAERAIRGVTEIESQIQIVRTGLAVLEEKSRNLSAILSNPLLESDAWELPAVQVAIKTALHLLVQKAVLVERERGKEYVVELWTYGIDAIIRELALGGSAYRLIMTNPIPLGLQPVADSVTDE